MVEEYLVFENHYAEENPLVAVPASAVHRQHNLGYVKKGSLSNVISKDFIEHGYWGFDYLPLEVVGSMTRVSNKSKLAVRDTLVSLCESEKVEFSIDSLFNDPNLRSDILDHEILSGHLYVVRFDGEDMKSDGEKITRSAAYFVSPEDDISINDDQLSLNNKSLDFGDNDLSYLTKSQTYSGELSIFEAGNFKFFRKSLKSFTSRGDYGGLHTNGPWIVRRDEVPTEPISRYKEIY